MHRLRLFILSLAFFLSVTTESFQALAVESTTEWTIMFYLDGDNNLEHAALMDLLEMEQALPENVEIAVLLDRHKGYSTVLGDASGTVLYRVRRAEPFDLKKAATGLPAPLPKSLVSEVLEDWGEADMSDPKTLTRFIVTSAKRFPARRYALIPWDHGSGAALNGMLNDEDGGNGSPGRGSMSLGEFAQAVRLGAEALPRKRFDLLKYELCLMGQLDVMAETATIADYAFASPPVEPSQGSDYLSILPLFRKDITTEELTRRMVDLNIAYYTELGRPAAFSAFDLSKMHDVTRSLHDLSAQLKDLASNHFRELTRATCYATHHENLLEDLVRGQKAMSSVEVNDWLDLVERELPDQTKDKCEKLREALRALVYHSSTTPNLPECRGVTLYLPLRREYEHEGYRTLPFSQTSGLGDYLSALYTAQETLGETKPRITNLALGEPKLIKGRDGRVATDFELTPLNHLTPFSRHVVRFDVTGSGILLTKFLQFEQHGDERHLHCEQLVAEHSDTAREKKAAQDILSEITPVYNEGTTTLQREITARYKVTNGRELADITIANVSATRDVLKNISTGYGLYHDATTGGQDILVQVQFSNLVRLPIRMIGFELDPSGKIRNMRELMPRTDGVFRPAVTVLDKDLKARRVFGPPLSLSTGTFLLTVDMIDEGTNVGAIIMAETMNGKKTIAVSGTLPVRQNKEQLAMRNQALSEGLNNLFGRYAMVQYASSAADTAVALPTFQTVEFRAERPIFTFKVTDHDQETGSGLLNWLPYGMPQISLHKRPDLAVMPLGETIQVWYAFLKGQGRDRIWYVIGMGDGTRWALIPLEQYEPKALEGVWRSKTEKWEFSGENVTLSRDGHTGKGTFRLKGHILTTTGMPAREYAVALDRAHGRMTLISRDGAASILSREETVAQPVPDGSAGSATSDKNQGLELTGSWISGPETGYAELTIRQVSGTPYFNLRLKSLGQGETRATFAVRPGRLLATFRDGSREVVGYSLVNGRLTLFFPRMPEISFTRKGN